MQFPVNNKEDLMILSLLTMVVKVIVAIFSVLFFCVKVVWNVVTDGANQAKAATPGVVDALKREAHATASKAPSVASKFENDMRKVFKVPTREKVEAASSN